MILQKKLLEFIKEKGGYRKVQEITGFSTTTLQDLKNENLKRKYKRRILDYFYNLFSIEKDEFYRTHLFEERKEKKNNIVGEFFKKKRIENGYTIHSIAKEINMSSRQIQKLEYGELNYNYDSFLIEKIFKKYNFSKKEKDAIILYSIGLEKISKL